MRKSITDQDRDLHLTQSAYELAAQKIQDGTASSQLILFFLKMGAEREKHQLELDRIAAETALAQAKVENLKSAEVNSTLVANAIKAIASYRAMPVPTNEELGLKDDDDY